MSKEYLSQKLKNEISHINSKIKLEMKRPRPSFMKLRQLKKKRLLFKDGVSQVLAEPVKLPLQSSTRTR